MTPWEIRNGLENAIKSVANENASPLHRQRKLPMETMLRLLIGMEGGSLDKVLHAAGIAVTASAVSQRRSQLPPAVFRSVLDRFNHYCGDDPQRVRDYRLLAVDGTVVSLPRNPAAPSFVQNEGIPKGVNQLHVTPLYDLLNRTFFDVVIQPEPKQDEIGALITMLDRNIFEQKSLIIADRGFESYNLLAHLQNEPNVDFLIRIKQNYSAMREVAKLPMVELDCNTSFTITTTQTKEDKERHHIFLQVPKKTKAGSKTRRGRWDFPSPYPMRFRICRFLLDNGEFETVATSLPPSFTLEDIKALYHRRWDIEVAYRTLKYSVGLMALHGKSDLFAEQEIYASLTAFNFTSRVCREVVIQQPTEGIYAYTVNFKMAVMLCKEFIRTPDADMDNLMKEIARYTVPIRPGRQDQRNLRVKGFPGFVYRIAA